VSVFLFILFFLPFLSFLFISCLSFFVSRH
jgi:hypothetical protein